MRNNVFSSVTTNQSRLPRTRTSSCRYAKALLWLALLTSAAQTLPLPVMAQAGSVVMQNRSGHTILPMSPGEIERSSDPLKD
jgi:hypothetical protein